MSFQSRLPAGGRSRLDGAILFRSELSDRTVRDLAARTAVSRSLLDQEFRAVLGRSPIRYPTEWRDDRRGPR